MRARDPKGRNESRLAMYRSHQPSSSAATSHRFALGFQVIAGTSRSRAPIAATQSGPRRSLPRPGPHSCGAAAMPLAGLRRTYSSILPNLARSSVAAVQASPFKLTAPEQFKEFAANIDYFVFEPNIHDLNDLGWRYLAQHMDMLLPPELLKAIDPVPFGKYAMQEEQGHFTEHGYISLSGDEWKHERPAEPEKKPSIRKRLEQGKKECAEKNKAQPHKEKSAPEL